MAYEMRDFQKDVIQQSHKIPVIVDFWAEWCGPCRMLGPILERLASEQKDKWTLVKLNTEQFPEIAKQYGVQGIPNVKMFVDGKVEAEFVGALPEAQIVQWLKTSLPSPYRHQIEQAKQLFQEGNVRKAQKILDEVVKAEPRNHQALILLASSCLYSDTQRALELIEPIREDSEYFDMAESLRTFGTLFQRAEQPDTLPESVVKKDYLTAIKQLQEQEFEDALKGFIEIVQIKRAYDDEGAKKACIAIFKFLGEDHDLTHTYRREFSSALYA